MFSESSCATVTGVNDIQNIDTILDKEAINSKYWRDENDLDKKRRKEAEFLVLGDIHVNAILGFIVASENAKKKVISCGADATNIHIGSEFYF